MARERKHGAQLTSIELVAHHWAPVACFLQERTQLLPIRWGETQLKVPVRFSSCGTLDRDSQKVPHVCLSHDTMETVLSCRLCFHLLSLSLGATGRILKRRHSQSAGRWARKHPWQRLVLQTRLAAWTLACEGASSIPVCRRQCWRVIYY